MSTKKGDTRRRRPQKYQNTFAFKAHTKSKKAKHVYSIPNEGVCQHCHDLIEWKKQYKKYKPLSQMKKCCECEEKKVKIAYHILCKDCCEKKNLCAKCKVNPVDIPFADDIQDEDILNSPELKLLSERQRRTFLRNFNKPNRNPTSKSTPNDEEEEDDLSSDEDQDVDEDHVSDEDGSQHKAQEDPTSKSSDMDDMEGYESFDENDDEDDIRETVLANRILKDALMKSKKIKEQLNTKTYVE